jgi:3-hydroxyisobutyrate dehydrogenase/2-hydroxy-3-oxopropionate reductase
MFLCVGDTAMSREVILGAGGLIEGAQAGSVVADASTISPSESRKIGEALEAKGVDFLDAPCTGSTPGAEEGTLTFMVGGQEAVFQKVKPYLELVPFAGFLGRQNLPIANAQLTHPRGHLPGRTSSKALEL